MPRWRSRERQSADVFAPPDRRRWSRGRASGRAGRRNRRRRSATRSTSSAAPARKPGVEVLAKMRGVGHAASQHVPFQPRQACRHAASFSFASAILRPFASKRRARSRLNSTRSPIAVAGRCAGLEPAQRAERRVEMVDRLATVRLEIVDLRRHPLLAEADGFRPHAERDLALAPRRRRGSVASPTRSDAPSASPSRRLIGGEPMKPATKRLSGCGRARRRCRSARSAPCSCR